MRTDSMQRKSSLRPFRSVAGRAALPSRGWIQLTVQARGSGHRTNAKCVAKTTSLPYIAN